MEFFTKAPAVLGTFKYLMSWHPRMNTDAAHLVAINDP
jgi:hypothetical protein